MGGDGASRGINFGVDSTTTTLFAKLFISHFDGVDYVDRFTINENGTVGIYVLGSAGATALCRNASNQIATCSSSIHYKSNVEDFRSGLDLIKRLRPVSFNWKDGNMQDLGLVAEEVAEIEPLLTTKNDKGDVEGVKYDRIGVVLINVVKEQQKRIDQQAEMIDQQVKKLERQEKRLNDQRKDFQNLKILVCSQSPKAELCLNKEEPNEED
jgi:hypothetical protein